jgi:hypothetical protein
MTTTKKTTQYLRNFQNGDYMCWHVCTQCGNLGTVEVKDDKVTYFTAKKTSPDWKLQHLAQGSAFYQGGTNLRVEITIETNYDLDVSPSSAAILDKSANNVGYIYTFCVEDSTDADYNDFYINIVAWREKG